MFPPVYGVVSQGENWHDGLDFAWQAKGAASAAASYIDLTGNGYTLSNVFGPAPTIGANGWVASGSTVLSAGIVPALNFTILVRVVTDVGVTGGGAILAADASGNDFRIYPNNPGGSTQWNRLTTYTQATSHPLDYTISINGNGDAYYNLSIVANVGQSAINSGDPNSAFGIMGFYNAGGSILAFASVVAVGGMLNTSLPNITDYISAMAAL